MSVGATQAHHTRCLTCRRPNVSDACSFKQESALLYAEDESGSRAGSAAYRSAARAATVAGVMPLSPGELCLWAGNAGGSKS